MGPLSVSRGEGGWTSGQSLAGLDKKDHLFSHMETNKHLVLSHITHKNVHFVTATRQAVSVLAEMLDEGRQAGGFQAWNGC